MRTGLFNNYPLHLHYEQQGGSPRARTIDLSGMIVASFARFCVRTRESLANRVLLGSFARFRFRSLRVAGSKWRASASAWVRSRDFASTTNVARIIDSFRVIVASFAQFRTIVASCRWRASVSMVGSFARFARACSWVRSRNFFPYHHRGFVRVVSVANFGGAPHELPTLAIAGRAERLYLSYSMPRIPNFVAPTQEFPEVGHGAGRRTRRPALGRRKVALDRSGHSSWLG